MLLACPSCQRLYDVSAFEAGARIRCHCGQPCTVPVERARQLEMLHCSTCGGRLAGAARACEYCSAEVRLADRGLGPACPRCLASTLKDARHCSSCGLRLEVTAVLRALSSRACPRCATGLIECEAEGTRYVECPGCAGLWLGEEQFEHLAQGRERAGMAALAIRGARSDGAAQAPLAGEPAVAYLPCPVCGELMNRRNFAALSGVILDWCRGHGWWFDARELERALAFVEKGGLERSRATLHDQRKEELRRAERLAQEPRTVPPMTFARARWTLIESLVDALLRGF